MENTSSTKPEPQFYWPAEWEAMHAIWLSWPHRDDLWQGQLQQLAAHYARLAKLISKHALVYINAEAALHAGIHASLQAAGVQAERYRLFNHPTNDVWCRDHGGIFVRNLQSAQLQLCDFSFNAWGGKFPPWDLDNQIPRLMAASQGLQYHSSTLIAEGGALEGNGQGTLLTTRAVLQNSNRNPQWSEAEIDAELRRMLGVKQVFWLDQGIEGDDTDGHIDDMVRFVNPHCVVAISEDNPKASNYRVLQENLERLQDLRHVDGSRIEVVKLPMPQPLRASNWRLEELPASYANFLFVNDALIVPTFEQTVDARALGILQELLPKHEVVGFDARALVLEGGAIHCITQQQPRD